jgi:hypothetical protein
VLDLTPPAKHYEPSLRPMPERLRAPTYCDDFVVRRVSSCGVLRFKGKVYNVSKLFADQPVGPGLRTPCTDSVIEEGLDL